MKKQKSQNPSRGKGQITISTSLTSDEIKEKLKYAIEVSREDWVLLQPGTKISFERYSDYTKPQDTSTNNDTIDPAHYYVGGYITFNGLSKFKDKYTNKEEPNFGLEGYPGASLKSGNHKVNYVPYYQIKRLWYHCDPIIAKIINKKFAIVFERVVKLERKLQS